METLIIQVDCRRYTRDGPPQLGITVEAPFLQRQALQQKKQQQHLDYQNHDYQNLDSDSFGLTNVKPNHSAINHRHNKLSTTNKHNVNSTLNKNQHVNEGLQITQIQRGSVIDRVGQFRIGDIIVEVNGVNLQRPFPEAQKTLKQFVADHTSHGPLVLKVLRKSASSSSIPSTTGSQVTVIEQDPIPKRQPSIPKMTGETPISKQTNGAPPLIPTSPKSTSSRTSRHLVGALNTRMIGVRHRIKLRKAANGFGIKIAERDNMHSTRSRPIYITAITTTGSAYQDGRLREGDMLLEVNGIDIQTLTQPEVTRMLKNIKANEEVEFVISRQEDLPNDEDRDDSVSSNNRLNSENNCDKSLIDLDVPDQDDSVFVESINDVQFEKKIDSILNVPIIDGPGFYTYDIPLNDTKSAGLGLYLKYPCRADERRDLGIWIEKVITGGAAWKDGRLQPDDQILAINGIELVGLSNAEASETLTAAVCRGIGPEATLNTIRLKIHRRSPSVVAKILQGTNNRIECSDILPNARSILSDKNIDNSRESYQTAFDNTMQDKASETRNSSNSSNQNSQNDSAMSPQTQASNSIKLTSSCIDKSDRSSSDKTNETTSSAISQITDSTSNVPNNGFTSISRVDYITNQYITNSKSVNQNSDDSKATKPKSIRVGDDEADIRHTDHESSSQSWDDESVDATNCEEHFQRDGFGRQSISEKRHAQLNAKNTDTFKKNQKAREEREQQRSLEEQMARQHLSDGKDFKVPASNTNVRLPTSYTTNDFKNIYGLRVNQEKPVQRERLVDDYHREVPVDVHVPHELQSTHLIKRNGHNAINEQFARLPNGEMPNSLYAPMTTAVSNHVTPSYQCAKCGCDMYSCVCRQTSHQTNMVNHFLSTDQRTDQVLKRSNSLESIQQHHFREDLIVPRSGTVRVARNRKINESFRAAVDRSYEGNMNGFSAAQDPSNLSSQQQYHMSSGTSKVASSIANSTTSTANEERHLITVKNNSHSKGSHASNNVNNNGNSNTTHKKSSSLLTKFLKLGSIKRKKKNKTAQNDQTNAEVNLVSRKDATDREASSHTRTQTHERTNSRTLSTQSHHNLNDYHMSSHKNAMMNEQTYIRNVKPSEVSETNHIQNSMGLQPHPNRVSMPMCQYQIMHNSNTHQHVPNHLPPMTHAKYSHNDLLAGRHQINNHLADQHLYSQNQASMFQHSHHMNSNMIPHVNPTPVDHHPAYYSYGRSAHVLPPEQMRNVSNNRLPMNGCSQSQASWQAPQFQGANGLWVANSTSPDNQMTNFYGSLAHHQSQQRQSNLISMQQPLKQPMNLGSPTDNGALMNSTGAASSSMNGVMQQAPVSNVQYHNNPIRQGPYGLIAPNQYPIHNSQPLQQVYYYDF